MKIKLRLFFSIAFFCLFGSLHAQQFTWAKNMGSPDSDTNTYDAASTVVLDAAGNIYTAGIFRNTADFDPGPGTFHLTAANTEIFISKFTADGSFVWAIKLGGPGADVASKMVIDSEDNLIVTGYFTGTADFDPGTGVQNLTSDLTDAYIAKFTSDGNLIWAKKIGGTGYTWGHDLTVSETYIVITGTFNGTADFDPGLSMFNLSASGAINGFILKLTIDGNYTWAKRIGGSSESSVTGVSMDQAGNVYVSGSFDQNVDMDPSAASFTLFSSGNQDIFFAKYDEAGNFIWTRRIGGSGLDYPSGFYQDDLGNIFSTGQYSGNVDFDPGINVSQLSSMATGIFVVKFDLNGDFIFAKGMNSSNTFATGNALTLDSAGNIFTTGRFMGTTDFNPGIDEYSLTSYGGSDIFISKLNTLGEFLWTQQIGSPINASEIGNDIIHDGNGNIIVVGTFQGTADFDAGTEIFPLTSYGGSDIFMYKATDGTLGVDAQVSNFELIMYPNPTNEYVIVNSPVNEAELTIFDIMGKKIHQTITTTADTKINTSEYATGVYLVQLKSNGTMNHKKLIVNR